MEVASVIQGMTTAPAGGGSGPARAGRDPMAAAEAIEDILDLGAPRDPMGRYLALAPEDRLDFLTQLAALLKQGIIGTETREVRGAPYTSFVDVGMADPRLRGARPYRPQPGPAPRVDLRA